MMPTCRGAMGPLLLVALLVGVGCTALAEAAQPGAEPRDAVQRWQRRHGPTHGCLDASAAPAAARYRPWPTLAACGGRGRHRRVDVRAGRRGADVPSAVAGRGRPYAHQFAGDMMKAPVLVRVALRDGKPVFAAFNKRPDSPVPPAVLEFVRFALSPSGQDVASHQAGFVSLPPGEAA